MHLFVGTHVLSVRVACQARMNQGVVEVGVELRDAAFVLPLDLYATQVLVPFPLGTRHDLTEVPAQAVGLKVLTCVLYRDVGEGKAVEDGRT